jgi:hypothetical protein
MWAEAGKAHLRGVLTRIDLVHFCCSFSALVEGLGGIATCHLDSASSRVDALRAEHSRGDFLYRE